MNTHSLYNGTIQVSFDPVKHVYRIGGVIIPSVTTIVGILEKLSSDGYDLDIYTHTNSIRVTVISENENLRVNRFIPIGCKPSEMALIFWDISSSIKRLERKFSRVDKRRS